jgi:predicted membrane-bound spermidine synthase
MLTIKKAIFPSIVFVTGACVLVLEVVATRVLSPYFGNTIYTVSSIIGVILAALSLGYFFGGKLADKRPAAGWFYAIILISGLSVIGLELINLLFLPALGNSLSLIYGPLITAVILFFLPAMLLATLSPYAIKLHSQACPEIGIGSVSGIIFFWSTLGSIAGSLLTGFVFIPNFGIDKIIIGVGVLLSLIGFLPLLKNGFKIKYFLLISLVLIFVVAEFIIIFLNSTGLVYSHDGVYEKLLIFDREYKGRPTRFFKQDRSSSAAMYIKNDELVFDYSKYYILYKLFKSDLKQTLVIGGGAYSIPKALLNEPGVELVEVAEIEPSLLDLGKKYFRVPEDSRLKNHVIDGRRWLQICDKKYDLIFSDVYFSLYSLPVHFTTEEFFKLAKSKLADRGIFMANLIGNLDGQPPSLIFSEMKTLKAVFPNSYFFAVNSPDSKEAQNIIFLGWNSDKIIDFTQTSIVNNPNEIISQAGTKLIDLSKINFSLYTKLTDNYSPVEYLTARVIN